jgi:hypothetical protein
VAGLLAARDALDGIIAASVPAGSDDPEACYAAGVATKSGNTLAS